MENNATDVNSLWSPAKISNHLWKSLMQRADNSQQQLLSSQQTQSKKPGGELLQPKLTNDGFMIPIPPLPLQPSGFNNNNGGGSGGGGGWFFGGGKKEIAIEPIPVNPFRPDQLSQVIAQTQLKGGTAGVVPPVPIIQPWNNMVKANPNQQLVDLQLQPVLAFDNGLVDRLNATSRYLNQDPEKKEENAKKDAAAVKSVEETKKDESSKKKEGEDAKKDKTSKEKEGDAAVIKPAEDATKKKEEEEVAVKSVEAPKEQEKDDETSKKPEVNEVPTEAKEEKVKKAEAPANKSQQKTPLNEEEAEDIRRFNLGISSDPNAFGKRPKRVNGPYRRSIPVISKSSPRKSSPKTPSTNKRPKRGNLPYGPFNKVADSLAGDDDTSVVPKMKTPDVTVANEEQQSPNKGNRPKLPAIPSNKVPVDPPNTTNGEPQSIDNNEYGPYTKSDEDLIKEFQDEIAKTNSEIPGVERPNGLTGADIRLRNIDSLRQNFPNGSPKENIVQGPFRSNSDNKKSPKSKSSIPKKTYGNSDPNRLYGTPIIKSPSISHPDGLTGADIRLGNIEALRQTLPQKYQNSPIKSPSKKYAVLAGIQPTSARKEYESGNALADMNEEENQMAQQQTSILQPRSSGSGGKKRSSGGGSDDVKKRQRVQERADAIVNGLNMVNYVTPSSIPIDQQAALQAYQDSIEKPAKDAAKAEALTRNLDIQEARQLAEAQAREKPIQEANLAKFAESNANKYI